MGKQAKVWMPVDDGTYHTDGPELIAAKNGGRLYIVGGGVATPIDLQQGYALCQLTEVAAPAPVPEAVVQTIEKALAYWYKASADFFFLSEDRDVELQRIDEASKWLDQQNGGDDES